LEGIVEEKERVTGRGKKRLAGRARNKRKFGFSEFGCQGREEKSYLKL